MKKLFLWGLLAVVAVIVLGLVLRSYYVLVIDEVGYLPLDDLGATIFFQLVSVVSVRYERGSIILTSNKSYGDWGSIFGDSIIATAILDRAMKVRGGEFSTGTMGNFQPELTKRRDWGQLGQFPA